MTLDVKPLHAENAPYTIDGQTSGGENATSVTEWDWFAQNKEAGCNIASVCWKSSRFAIAPVRGLGVGSSLTEVTDSYLCVHVRDMHHVSELVKYEMHSLRQLLPTEIICVFHKLIVALIHKQ